MSKLKHFALGSAVFLATWFAVAWVVRRYFPENIKQGLRV